MSKAIRIHAHGGPEVMRWEDVPTPEPGPGEALVQHTAVGLNYIDVYSRKQIEALITANQPTLLLVEHDAVFLQHVCTRPSIALNT